MDTIDQQFANYSGVFEILELIALVFLAIILAEAVWDIFIQKRRKIAESAANIAIAISNSLLERTVYGLVFIIGLVIAQPLSPLAIPETWWSWILALLLADFTYYWMHRCEHEVRILWAYHSVHHSSPEFNLTTGLRLAWVEGLIEWLFFVPMILMGFSVVQTIIALAVVVTYQTWIHTEKIGRLGWMDKVFNTPSVHRVHHASNRQYHDKNYGGILMLWDHLFGTYQKEKEKVVYGITTPVDSSNPFTINFYEFWQIIKSLKNAASWRERLGYLFNRPGWHPTRQ